MRKQLPVGLTKQEHETVINFDNGSQTVSCMRKQVDKHMAKELLLQGRTHVDDLYSQKKGKTFAADLLLEMQDGRANFKLEFPKFQIWQNRKNL